MRNKRPADMTAFRPERTVVYVHGATYPASTAFDLKLDGLSWMDYIAARGYDRVVVGHVLQMVKRNEYKRRQAPPGIRVSNRAFGRAPE